jgi:hypothetical protein
MNQLQDFPFGYLYHNKLQINYMKQHFVLRLKDNIQLNHKKSLKGFRTMDSNVTADFTCTLGTAKTNKGASLCRAIYRSRGQRNARRNEFNGYHSGRNCGTYKSRWAIESFFRWIKQNLNVPVLFETKKNEVFNQLFATLFALVLLKILHVQGNKKNSGKPLPFASFSSLLICDALPLE